MIRSGLQTTLTPRDVETNFYYYYVIYIFIYYFTEYYFKVDYYYFKNVQKQLTIRFKSS